MLRLRKFNTKIGSFRHLTRFLPLFPPSVLISSFKPNQTNIFTANTDINRTQQFQFPRHDHDWYLSGGIFHSWSHAPQTSSIFHDELSQPKSGPKLTAGSLLYCFRNRTQTHTLFVHQHRQPSSSSLSFSHSTPHKNRASPYHSGWKLFNVKCLWNVRTNRARNLHDLRKNELHTFITSKAYFKSLFLKTN